MLSAAPRATLKVVFHCRVLFPLRTHINFTRVNKMYGRSRVHFKVERRLTWPSIHCVYYTYVCTHGKIRDSRNPFLRLFRAHQTSRVLNNSTHAR